MSGLIILGGLVACATWTVWYANKCEQEAILKELNNGR